MRHTQYLPNLGKSALYRLDGIYANIGDPKILGTCAIDSQTLMYNFFRSYFISCMLGTRTSRNDHYKHIGSPIATSRDAIDLYMRLRRPKRYSASWTGREEPPWHKPDTLIDALQRLGNPALPFVTSAFGAGYLVFDNIINIRNYYAHKNMDTLSEALNNQSNYGLTGKDHPKDILLSYPIGSTSKVIENWYFEIYDTIEYLCL